MNEVTDSNFNENDEKCMCPLKAVILTEKCMCPLKGVVRP